MDEQRITLTPAQEKIVLDTFQGRSNDNLPSISELVKLVFPEVQNADGRSQEGRAIKILLAQKGLKANTTSVYQPKNRRELTEEDKELIANNHQNNATPVQIARIVFNNPNLTNLHVETRTIAEYIRQTYPENITSEVADIPETDYRPPKSFEGALKKVEKYVFGHSIDKNNITAQQKAGLEALLSYMNTFRFIHQVNLYESQTSRDLFESSFVRYTYDKPDLTEEECDQYITLSHEVVVSSSIQTRIERLQVMMEEASGNDRARISMGLVEAINTLQTEYNQSVTRSQKLLGDLKEKRSERIAEARSAHASILNLIQLWKEEKTRKKLLHLADARKKLLEKAVHELSGMEEIKTRIMGLDPNETIHA